MNNTKLLKPKGYKGVTIGQSTFLSDLPKGIYTFEPFEGEAKEYSNADKPNSSWNGSFTHNFKVMDTDGNNTNNNVFTTIDALHTLYKNNSTVKRPFWKSTGKGKDKIEFYNNELKFEISANSQKCLG